MSPGGVRTFVAVDGTALAYRSHFAFINRPLTTKSGEVTSAVFGFILTLRRILEELSPDAIVVVFDPEGPTFRHESFPDYKAQRERMPPDLRAQLPRIRQYLEAAGIPWLEVEGYEADDALATLALRAVRGGLAGCIVSNDKDLLQLVGEGVEVVALGRGSEPLRRMDRAEIEESFGVSPEQIVDYLALTGDASDNVPGVPGVGKKTAAKLLAEHGNLKGLLAAAASMKKGKLRDNLLAAKDEALFSRSLIELVTDVDVPEPESLRPRRPDAAALRALYDELDFRSLQAEPSVVVAADRSGYEVAATGEEVAAAAKAAREAGRFAWTAAAEGKDARRAELVGLALAVGGGKGWYVPLAHRSGGNVPWAEARRALQPVLEDDALPKWGHDTKRDRLLLSRHEIRPRGEDFDTMLASYVLDPSRREHGIEILARERLGVEAASLASLTGTGRSRVPLDAVPAGEVGTWAVGVADHAFALRDVLETELAAQGLMPVLCDVELPLLRVLERMEEAGVRLDTEYLARLSDEMADQIGELERRAREAAGEEFNLGSPKQVAEILFGKLGLKPMRRTKTGQSTDADVLAALAEQHELPGLVLRHREVSKLKSTYVDALPQMVDPKTGRVHTTFQQAVAATGRLSSADPNLQNVPVRTEEGRRIRQAFVPSGKDWVLVSCDYSQIELRILAHMARDEPLRDAFREDRDVHRATAALIFDVPEDRVSAEQRAQAKTINFAVIYGMGAVNLGRSLGIPTREASRFIEAYFARYPGVRAFIDETQRRAREMLYVETLLGRRRPIPEIASADHRTRAFGERIAVNTPIQGTAADIMKLAMIAVQRALDEGGFAARMILTVHDELVLDCPSAEREEVSALVRERMAGAMELSVPLRVGSGWGSNWSEAH